MPGPRIPANLLLVIGLLAIGTVATAASLVIQRLQTERNATQAAEAQTGGHVQAGRALFAAKGCGACHAIAGKVFAQGAVGPPLDKLAGRAFIAGRLPNDPSHMIAWIQRPQSIEPGGGMPDTGLTDAEARDVAAYLYTLR